MAYADIGAKSTSDTLTLNNWNGIRNNFLAGVPGIFTTKGDIVIATGSQVATRVGIGADDSTLVADSNQPGGAEWQIQPAARVYATVETPSTLGSWVPITFDAERYDTDALHSTVSNNTRITIPASGAGLYFIGAQAQLSSSTVSTCDVNQAFGLQIILNSGTIISQNFESYSNENTRRNMDRNIETVYPLNAGDYVEARYWDNENLRVQVVANISPEFYVHWLRRT